MPDFDQVAKHKTLIAGEPIQYTVSTKTLRIAGDDIPLERWLEIRRQIDLLIKRTTTPEEWKSLKERMAWLGKRDRLPTELRDHEPTNRTEAPSDFLNANFETIMRRVKAGRLKPAPWWIRWLWDWVVTKEPLQHWR